MLIRTGLSGCLSFARHTRGIRVRTWSFLGVLIAASLLGLSAEGGEKMSANKQSKVLSPSTKIEVIGKTYRTFAKKHSCTKRAVEFLLKAISTAKGGKKTQSVKKHLASLSLLEQWVNRPDFYNPPVVKQPHKRREGEKLDLMVFGPPEDYASFPNITQSEDRIILYFGVQPMSVVRRIKKHPHYQVLTGPCWTVSKDGGYSWRTTRKRPKYGNVLHASRTMRHLGGRWLSRKNLKHPFGNDFEFRAFDYAKFADGSLLAAGTGFPDPAKPKAIVFARSEDKGLSWQLTTPLFATDVLGGYTEPALYIGNDGRAICVIRTKWGNVDPKLWPPGVRGDLGDPNEPGYGWYFYQSESTDHGRTWSTPASNGIWGHPANILRLASGKVLMVYGHRKPPWSVRAILSRDDGRTWDMETMRTLHEFNPCLTDFGYPTATQLPNGTIICTYYGYSTTDTTRWASPHGIFVSIFDEKWLNNKQ